MLFRAFVYRAFVIDFLADKISRFVALDIGVVSKGSAMSIDLNKAREIFIEAVGKVSADRWPAFLAERCGADAELRRHVEHLLQAHGEAASFLDKPTGASYLPDR